MTHGASPSPPVRLRPRGLAVRQACRRKLRFNAIRGIDPAMLGRDHARSGALAFAALGPSLHVTGSHLATGVLLAAGAGTLPDIDHPDSTISCEFGFLTQAFAWCLRGQGRRSKTI